MNNPRDCNPNWSSCPIEKRVWFEQNMDLVENLLEAVKGGQWIFWNNDMKALALKMYEDGMYSRKSGRRDVQGCIGRHIMNAFDIKWSDLYSKKIKPKEYDRLKGLPSRYQQFNQR